MSVLIEARPKILQGGWVVGESDESSPQQPLTSVKQIPFPWFHHEPVITRTPDILNNVGLVVTVAGEHVPQYPKEDSHQLPLLVSCPAENGSSESPITDPLALKSRER